MQTPARERRRDLLDGFSTKFHDLKFKAGFVAHQVTEVGNEVLSRCMVWTVGRRLWSVGLRVEG